MYRGSANRRSQRSKRSDKLELRSVCGQSRCDHLRFRAHQFEPPGLPEIHPDLYAASQFLDQPSTFLRQFDYTPPSE